MPDEPEKPKNLPGRHRPRLSDLAKETTEEDLWDLEEEHDSSIADPSAQAKSEPEPEKPRTEPAVPPKPSDAESRPKPSKPAVSSHQTKRATAIPEVRGEATSRPAPPKAARPNGPRIHDPKSSTPSASQADQESAAQKPAEPKPEPKPEQRPEPEKKQSSPAKTPGKLPVGKSEKTGLIALGIVFLGVAAWWIISLFSSIATTRLGDDQPEFPSKGDYITIENAETYWRVPIRDGALPDVARSEVEFIPVLKITIDDSEAGVLRAIFRNEQGDFVGDSISQPFANGVFDNNANLATEFPATDGFMNSGEFNGYRVGDDRWTVEVFEGPSADASGSEFKLLFTAPISPNRQ